MKSAKKGRKVATAPTPVPRRVPAAAAVAAGTEKSNTGGSSGRAGRTVGLARGEASVAKQAAAAAAATAKALITLNDENLPALPVPAPASNAKKADLVAEAEESEVNQIVHPR